MQQHLCSPPPTSLCLRCPHSSFFRPLRRFLTCWSRPCQWGGQFSLLTSFDLLRCQGALPAECVLRARGRSSFSPPILLLLLQVSSVCCMGIICGIQADDVWFKMRPNVGDVRTHTHTDLTAPCESSVKVVLLLLLFCWSNWWLVGWVSVRWWWLAPPLSAASEVGGVRHTYWLVWRVNRVTNAKKWILTREKYVRFVWIKICDDVRNNWLAVSLSIF